MIEVFKFKDLDAQTNFKIDTTETSELSKIIDQNKSIDIVTKKFLKRLKSCIHKNFKKVRIVDKPDKTLEELYNKRRILRTKTDEHSIKELENVDKELSEKDAEQMSRKIKSEVQGVDNGEEGGFNAGKLWKLKTKLAPRNNDPPTAMFNKDGKLLTSEKDIIEEAEAHYTEVFKEKSIKAEYTKYQEDREELCRRRLAECSQNKTKEWSISDVTSVLKNLKIGKSKDAYDLPNEIFKPGVAGQDLILAVTKLMNRIKNELSYPTLLELCNVTNLYKRKGDRRSFNSYRGIFRAPVLSNILDKLLHNDEYEIIDENLTDGNVGSQKRRNVRDNLFVINSVMNEAKCNKTEALDINVYDVEKCFDSMTQKASTTCSKRA